MSYCADKLVIDTHTRTQTDAGNENTWRPKLVIKLLDCDEQQPNDICFMIQPIDTKLMIPSYFQAANAIYSLPSFWLVVDSHEVRNVSCKLSCLQVVGLPAVIRQDGLGWRSHGGEVAGWQRIWGLNETRSIDYREIFNIRRTKTQNLNDSRLVLHLSLHNLLKPAVK